MSSSTSKFWKSVRRKPCDAPPGGAIVLLQRLVLPILFASVILWPATGIAEPALPVAVIAKQLLETARKEAASGCTPDSDTLLRIICAGEIRVGLRTDYPRFSVRDAAGQFNGFEVDLAEVIARFLGVRLIPVAVTPSSRIPALGSRSVDLVIATMGHTVQRDSQALFVMPHYYQSRTAVVGAHDNPVANWSDLRAGHTACVPLGASFNILFAQRHVHTMTFETASQLVDALNFNRCSLVVHDDTFFMSRLADQEWTDKFGIKFSFAPLPWGMAVARTGATQLGQLLGVLSVAFHADEVFIRLAEANGIDISFLKRQQEKWSIPGCVAERGLPSEPCLLAPADTSAQDRRTSFAPTVTAVETIVRNWFDVKLDLSILKSSVKTELLLEGIGFSLALIIGSMSATLMYGLTLAAFGRSRFRLIRWTSAGLCAVGQTTPMPLLMFFGYIIAGGLIHYSALVALITAILVLGFYNGAYLGQALEEARQSLLRSHTAPGNGQSRSVSTGRGAVVVAWAQLVAFLVNATKGSPAANMIGVPEFLAVLSDLTAHLQERIGVYLVLL
ncbi:MAG: transporter substrate-binding domain-containing protein, partial [Acetobacteraceae bacterium]